MPHEFVGTARPMTRGAIEQAARTLGCPVAAIRAVIEVEGRGGFRRDDRPALLFERHYFHRLTGGRYSADFPDISNPRWGGYGRSSAQYDRLQRAIALDRDAALRSASWGAFQIMGDNYAVAGFDDVEDFVAAMMAGEDEHLAAFVSFIRATGLADELCRGDWAGFARQYNGPAYRRNRYDEKLADAYARYAAEAQNVPATPILREGSRGEAVRELQRVLGLHRDGDFGPLTKAAVLRFQQDNGLFVDGVVGPQSWAALRAMPG